jgi:hypothetical protein
MYDLRASRAPSVMPHHPAARTRIFGCRTRAAPPRGTLEPPGPAGRPRYRLRPGSHPADLSSKRPRLAALLLSRSLLVLFHHHDRHDNSIGGSTMNQDRAYPSSTTTCRPGPPRWMASRAILAALGGGSMQDSESELRRMILPRTPVNRAFRDRPTRPPRPPSSRCSPSCGRPRP